MKFEFSKTFTLWRKRAKMLKVVASRINGYQRYQSVLVVAELRQLSLVSLDWHSVASHLTKITTYRKNKLTQWNLNKVTVWWENVAKMPEKRPPQEFLNLQSITHVKTPLSLNSQDLNSFGKISNNLPFLPLDEKIRGFMQVWHIHLSRIVSHVMHRTYLRRKSKEWKRYRSSEVHQMSHNSWQVSRRHLTTLSSKISCKRLL